MSDWALACPWCGFRIEVNNRGGPYGAGEEAAAIMRPHVEAHAQTWETFLARTEGNTR